MSHDRRLRRLHGHGPRWRGHRQGGIPLDPPRTSLSVEDVRPSYSGGVGDLTLDLSDLEFRGVDQPVRTSVQHGIGDVEVIVPRSADVRVEVQNGLGSVDLFDAGYPSGAYFPGRGSASWTDDGDPEIRLRIDAGLGDVEVSRG